MCDEAKLNEWAKQKLSRRQFGVLAGSTALVACGPYDGMGRALADGTDDPKLITTYPTFDTADGTMDAAFVVPAAGKHPAIIIWPDIASLRDAKIAMARRLAGEGYAVLVMNPYYRDVRRNQFDDFAGFIQADGFQKVRPWREKLTADAIGRDAKAAVAWLDAQAEVDTSRGIGVQGYCMGGPFTIWSAAAAPGRIRAAASFHGGGLVREGDPRSPHNMLDEVNASLLIAIAQDDDTQDPEAKVAFAAAAREAGVPAMIEVYSGDHGWTVPDSPAFAAEAAQSAYADLKALYAAAL